MLHSPTYPLTHPPTTDHPQHPSPPHKTLPTMYALPSENPEQPGVPDEFHVFQSQLLRETCQSPTYPAKEIFIGTDIKGLARK